MAASLRFFRLARTRTWLTPSRSVDPGAYWTLVEDSDGSLRCNCPSGTIRHECEHQRQLGHLCCQPSCVRMDHLEPVPSRLNTLRGNGPSARNARKTTCTQGHEYTVGTYGRRICRPCINACRRRNA